MDGTIITPIPCRLQLYIRICIYSTFWWCYLRNLLFSYYGNFHNLLMESLTNYSELRSYIIFRWKRMRCLYLLTSYLKWTKKKWKRRTTYIKPSQNVKNKKKNKLMQSCWKIEMIIHSYMWGKTLLILSDINLCTTAYIKGKN